MIAIFKLQIALECLFPENFLLLPSVFLKQYLWTFSFFILRFEYVWHRQHWESKIPWNIISYMNDLEQNFRQKPFDTNPLLLFLYSMSYCKTPCNLNYLGNEPSVLRAPPTKVNSKPKKEIEKEKIMNMHTHIVFLPSFSQRKRSVIYPTPKSQVSSVPRPVPASSNALQDDAKSRSKN